MLERGCRRDEIVDRGNEGCEFVTPFRHPSSSTPPPPSSSSRHAPFAPACRSPLFLSSNTSNPHLFVPFSSSLVPFPCLGLALCRPILNPPDDVHPATIDGGRHPDQGTRYFGLAARSSGAQDSNHAACSSWTCFSQRCSRFAMTARSTLTTGR